MAFRIRADESLQDGIQRIALEQMDKAIDELNDRELGSHETVHQVRKRCKKIRGLIRLVRPEFEETYDRENAWYRDAARPLSYVRDAQALVETFDKLTGHYEAQIDSEAFADIRQRLIDRRESVAEDEVGLRERLDEFRDRLHEGRERIAAWRLQQDGFDAVARGLRKTYVRGRKAMKTAYRKPSMETFHEWRKRAKYHWYHMRLLRPVWSGPLKKRRNEAAVLSDFLGDDHDLSILCKSLSECSNDFGMPETIRVLTGLISRRQVELRMQAETLGARIFAENGKRFTKRLRAYWKAWHTEIEAGSQLRHSSGNGVEVTP